MSIGTYLFLIFCFAVLIELSIYIHKEVSIVLHTKRQLEQRRKDWPNLYEAQVQRYHRQFNLNTDKGDKIDDGPIH